MLNNNHKIILTGTESSGKTTLAKALANHYYIDFAAEYAREYLEQYGVEYDFDDVLKIAQRQAELDKEDYLIYDTDLLVLKVWIEEKYNQQIDWIEKAIKSYKNRIYLLCDYNIPYENDVLREHPNFDERKRLYFKYKSLLKELNLSFLEVSGSVEERVKKSIHFIDAVSKL